MKAPEDILYEPKLNEYFNGFMGKFMAATIEADIIAEGILEIDKDGMKLSILTGALNFITIFFDKLALGITKLGELN